jgi:pyrroloquinoline quinone biosynthesis protein D
VSRILRKTEGAYSETMIDEEVVVMSLESGDFFSLTGTAQAIWMLIDGSRTREMLLADLAAKFDCDPADITSDVNAFLAQLSAAGLLAGD